MEDDDDGLDVEYQIPDAWEFEYLLFETPDTWYVLTNFGTYAKIEFIKPDAIDWLAGCYDEQILKPLSPDENLEALFNDDPWELVHVLDDGHALQMYEMEDHYGLQSVLLQDTLYVLSYPNGNSIKWNKTIIKEKPSVDVMNSFLQKWFSRVCK